MVVLKSFLYWNLFLIPEIIFNRAKTADTTVNEALSLHGKTTEAFRKQQPKYVVKKSESAQCKND